MVGYCQNRQRTTAIPRGQIVKLGCFHFDTENAVPGHLLVQIRAFVVENIRRVDAAHVRRDPFTFGGIGRGAQKRVVRAGGEIQFFEDAF